MKEFQDTDGRRHAIKINVLAIKRVKEWCDVDLLEMVNGGLQEKFASDIVKLVEVLHCLCHPEEYRKDNDDAHEVQRAKIDKSLERFCERLDGESLERASEALMEELIDFFPKSRRKFLTSALEKAKRIQHESIAAAEAKIEQIDLDVLERSGNSYMKSQVQSG